MGQTILGFGLLFLGMITMSEAVYPLRESIFFLNMLANAGKHPLLGVLVATLFTAVIQSSSATTGIIIALALQDLLTLESAVPLILGSNIGTCITALLAAIGASLPARKAAFAHIIFNIFGVLLALIFLKPFTGLILETSPTVARQVANAHTLLMFLIRLFCFLFKYFIRFVNWAVPGEETVLEMGPSISIKDIENPRWP